MKKTIFLASLASMLMLACSDNDSTTWTISNVVYSGDNCQLEDPEEPFEGTMSITIDGSNVTLAHTELTIEGSTSDFSEQDDDVTLTNKFEEPVETTDCIVEQADTFVVSATDGDLRLENNDALTVVWSHTETDVSNTANTCNDGDHWFVSLPCTSQVTFDLTKAE